MKKLLTFFILAIAILPAVSFAQLKLDDTGLTKTGEEIYGSAQTELSIGTYIATTIIKPLFGLLGLIFLIFFIYGGVLWMTDSGNSQNVGKAKKILSSTLIGLIIILLSYGISQYIFEAIQ